MINKRDTMEFKVSDEINVYRTSLQGYINISYSKLVKIFGLPTSTGDGYKVDAEWSIKFADGIVATIYNYKNGINYCGKNGTPVEHITNWNIGGYNYNSNETVGNVVRSVENATTTDKKEEL